jgi:8-oxo-dGTP pyrophosphatase MutT (NUDIX family)
MENINNEILDFHQNRKMNILKSFTDFDEGMIMKSHIVNFTAVAAIVVSEDKLLLGLCNCDDERHEKWCFPGGGIDMGEDCTSAAIREVYEEMGIICQPLNQIVFQHPTKPTVGFVFLLAPDFKVAFNEEYFEAKWFSLDDLPYNILNLNREIIDIFFSGALMNDTV